MAGLAIQRHVERTVIFRIGTSPAAPEGIVGREHTADKADDGEAMLAVIAQRIDIPPAVATGRNRRIEARDAIRLSAARRPESAAIGTPGPGCTLPPAR